MISNVFAFSRLFASKGNEIQADMVNFVASPQVEPNVFTGMARPFGYIGELKNTFYSSPTLEIVVPTLSSGDKYEVLAIGSFAELSRNGTPITPFSANSVYQYVDIKGVNEQYTEGICFVVDELDDTFSGDTVNYVSVRTDIGIPGTPIGGKAGAFSDVVFYGRKVES